MTNYMLVVVVGWMDGDDDGSYNDGDKSDDVVDGW